RRGPEVADRRPDPAGTRGLLPAAHPARKDRHPPRRARRPPAEDGGEERARAGRRRVADRDPAREVGASFVGASHMSHVYCPECGFQNPESANFCARCGAALVRPDEGETTMTFVPEEGDDALADVLEDVAEHGPALVVRSGGGRAGEMFHP